MSFSLHPQLKADSVPVGDFELSSLLMINDDGYPWFILVPRRADILDAYQLARADHEQLTRESRALSKALMRAFKGEKLNVAALGNMVPQYHLHHIVRYTHDPAWPGPIWGHQPLEPMSAAQIKARFDLLLPALARESADAGIVFNAH